MTQEPAATIVMVAPLVPPLVQNEVVVDVNVTTKADEAVAATLNVEAP